MLPVPDTAPVSAAEIIEQLQVPGRGDPGVLLEVGERYSDMSLAWAPLTASGRGERIAAAQRLLPASFLGLVPKMAAVFERELVDVRLLRRDGRVEVVYGPAAVVGGSGQGVEHG